jgi:hypothetical protein
MRLPSAAPIIANPRTQDKGKGCSHQLHLSKWWHGYLDGSILSTPTEVVRQLGDGGPTAPAVAHVLPDGDGIDRHADPASQEQGTEDKEKFVGLILS